MAAADSPPVKPPGGSVYGPIHISGSAKVQLGDTYANNQDVFESGTADQQRAVTLNLLYYEGLDVRREQLALSDVGPDSFAWVENTSFPTWLRSGSTPFWIRGKPGSGKSTLMKHLAESQDTFDRIKADGNAWAIVYFFFDYRAGRKIANRILGMLKLFLRQLSNRVPGFQPLLVEREARAALRSDSEERHIDVIADNLKLTGYKVCAFVDGLDEYEGDLWDLGTTLERLRDRAGIKMCLAGRPETAFETMFANYPSVTMQDHNRASMQVYIERKVSKLLAAFPFVEHLFPKSLRDAIADKAQGVILWARLVVDEMVKSCNDSTTMPEMKALLESLPADLEPLYERILGKTNEKYQKETALLLHLIIENPGLTTPTLLYQAWSFLQDTHFHESVPALQVNNDAYKARLKALLGNLVDFVTARYEPKRHWSFVQDHDFSISIRLIHKSLSTYLDRSLWIQQRLPLSLMEMYPNFVWRRLAFAMLDQVDRENAVNNTKLQDQMRERADGGQVTQVSIVRFKEEWLRLPKWHNRKDILLYFVANCFNVDAQGYHEQSELDPALNFTTSSTTASLLHFMLCRKCLDYASGSWNARRIERIYDGRVLGWVLNVFHGSYAWACDELARLLPSLPKRLLQDLFDIALILEPWRNAGRAATHISLLKSFSENGYCVEGRHICSLLTESSGLYSLRSRAIIEAVTWRPTTKPWSPEHDDDCPNISLDAGVWCHWLERPSGLFYEQTNLLKLFALLGADVNQPLHGGKNGTLIEAIISRLPQHPYFICKNFFDIAIQSGHTDAGSLKALLAPKKASIKPIREQQIGRFRRKAGKTERSKKHGFQSSKDTFIEEIINALEYYELHDCKWPDFASTLPAEAVRTPRLNPSVRNGSGGFDANRLHTLLESVIQRDLEPDVWLEDLAKKVPGLITGISGNIRER